MPQRATSRESAFPLTPPSPAPPPPHRAVSRCPPCSGGSRSRLLRIATGFPASPRCIRGVSPRERDVPPAIRTGFSFLAVPPSQLLLPASPGRSSMAAPRSLSSLFLSLCLFLFRFFLRSTVPQDLTNRLIRSSFQIPFSRASRDAVCLRPPRSIYSAPKPVPYPILFSLSLVRG